MIWPVPTELYLTFFRLSTPRLAMMPCTLRPGRRRWRSTNLAGTVTLELGISYYFASSFYITRNFVIIESSSPLSRLVHITILYHYEECARQCARWSERASNGDCVEAP